jgi:hypothetical protein
VEEMKEMKEQLPGHRLSYQVPYDLNSYAYIELAP